MDNPEHVYSAYRVPEMRQLAAEQLTAQSLPSSADDVTCGAQQALQPSIRALVNTMDEPPGVVSPEL